VELNYGETRLLAYGPIEDRLFCAAFTVRGENIRIISLRKANSGEIKRSNDMNRKLKIPSKAEEKKIYRGIQGDRDTFEANDEDFARLGLPVRYRPPVYTKRPSSAAEDREALRRRRSRNR
jgi:hypothetical protein